MKRVNRTLLQNKVQEKFQFVGVSEQDAAIIADILVDADASGVTSHGTIRLEHYINRVKAGGINIYTKFPVQKGTFPWSFCIDAEGGFGHLASKKAVELGVKTVQKQGIAIVLIKNTSHCGRLGYYSKMAAEKEVISFITLNTDKCVAPQGGKNSYFGTNPMAWGFPSDEENSPVIVDMATSEKTLGEILISRDKGEKIPPTWALDKNGVPTTDPNQAVTLLPMAAHKGYALAFVAETLSAILTGSDFGPNLAPMYKQLSHKRNLSAFFLFFTPNLYQDTQSFTGKLGDMINDLHKQDLSKHTKQKKVLIPGEMQKKNIKDSEKKGVLVLDTVCEFLGL